MRAFEPIGRLYLEGEHVGDVAIRRWQGAWGFGQFSPNAAFERFATIFREWSTLMHTDAPSERLSPVIAARLRKTEYAMYAMHAKIFIADMQQWREIAILNIDGSLIEWKERYGQGEAKASAAARAAGAEAALGES
jgi:hypothetical protein